MIKDKENLRTKEYQIRTSWLTRLNILKDLTSLKPLQVRAPMYDKTDSLLQSYRSLNVDFQLRHLLIHGLQKHQSERIRSRKKQLF